MTDRAPALMIALLVTAVCLASLAGCAAPPPGPGATVGPDAGEAGDDNPSAADLGPLDEATFASLHELNTDMPDALPGVVRHEVDILGAMCTLSLPEDADAPLPGVVVIHEWWGLNDHIRRWADRLALEGYAALAVDLYEGREATEPSRAMEYMREVDDDRALEILGAARAFLAEDPRVQAPRTAAIGWCFGGGWSLRLAMHDPELDAAVMYYGRPVTDPDALRSIRAPLLGIFGTLDQGIPPDTVARFDNALDEAGVTHEIHSYPAPHAFANPSSARYHAGPAAQAWGEARRFLDKHLR